MYQLAQLCSDLTGEFIGEDFICSGFHPIESLPDHFGRDIEHGVLARRVSLRQRQEDRAKEDVKAELIIDRIASTENIDATEEDIQHELEHLAGHSGESAEAIRARLTKQGALDRMKAKLRSDKTLDWLAQNANVRNAAAAAGS